MKSKFFCIAAFVTWTAFGSSIRSDDWPQWRGPNRDDVSKEKGLLQDWPEGGPKLLWANDKCGLGYSGFSIVGDRLFTLGMEDGKQFLLCLNAVDGAEVWRSDIGGAYDNNWGGGPRSTPTVDHGQVFALSADGNLSCHAADSGKEIWKVDLRSVGGEIPGWGYCESVLVDGNQVVCTPGGDQGAIIAVDRKTGNKIWQTSELKGPAHYSSIVKASIEGREQYVQLLMSAVVGIDPAKGEVLWKSAFPGNVAVIPTPVVHENGVYVTAGYNAGCQRVDVVSNEAKVAWANKVMKNHHGGVIRIGDHLFGFSDDRGWTCQDWKSGEAVWSEKGKLGKGAIGYADGRLYCISEDKGEVVLIEPSLDGWKEHGRFTLSPQTKRRKPAGRVWVHPVIANGRLYLRDQEIIHCYDVKQ